MRVLIAVLLAAVPACTTESISMMDASVAKELDLSTASVPDLSTKPPADLKQTPSPDLSDPCRPCMNGSLTSSCATAYSSCSSDSKCKALIDCYEPCNTNACYEACNSAADPTALQLLSKIYECACTACENECVECAELISEIKSRGHAADCTVCAEGNACDGQICAHYTDYPVSWCTRPCRDSSECGAGMECSTEVGFCIHTSFSTKCSTDYKALVTVDTCDIEQKRVNCPAGQICDETSGTAACKVPPPKKPRCASCSANADCESGACIAWNDHPSVKFCAMKCITSGSVVNSCLSASSFTCDIPSQNCLPKRRQECSSDRSAILDTDACSTNLGVAQTCTGNNLCLTNGSQTPQCLWACSGLGGYDSGFSCSYPNWNPASRECCGTCIHYQSGTSFSSCVNR